MKRVKKVILILCCIVILGIVGCRAKNGNDPFTSIPTSTPTYDVPSNTSIKNPSVSISNDIEATDEGNELMTETQVLISVDDAQKVVEDFARRADIGVQVTYYSKSDIEINGVKYYYFDIVYGSLMGDKSELEEDTITKVFVSSKDKTLYEAIMSSDGTLSIGKMIANPSQVEDNSVDDDSIYNAENDSIDYYNERLKFQITFPGSWKDKYYITEYESGIIVRYNTEVGKRNNIYFFGIFIREKSDWESMEEGGAPEIKIMEKDGIVYSQAIPSQAEFDMNKEDERKDAEEFFRMCKDTDNIIKSLKVME